MKYRKESEEVEAMLWDGKHHREMFDFLTNNEKENEPMTAEESTFYIDFCNGGCKTGDLIIKTLEGDIKASIGDYVIKYVNGAFYPWKPDIFKKTYVPVTK